MSPARRLIRYLLRYRLRYAAGIGCLLLATALSLGIPWTLKNGVDALARDGRAADLSPYVLTILLLAAAHGVARLGSRFTILGAGQWVEHDLRGDLYAHLQTLPPGFYQRQRTGDLMSRASSDVAAVRLLAGFGGLMLVGTSFVFLGTVGAMWAIDPWLTLWAMAPFPCLVLVARRFTREVDTRSTAVQEQLGTLAAKVQENLAGAPVVRAYTMEAREIEAFGRLNREYLVRSLGLAKVQAVSWPLMGLISGLGALVLLWLGGKAVVDGRMTLGGFVAFNGFLAHLAWPTIALGWTLANVQRGLASMRRVGEILDAPALRAAAGGEASASGRSASVSEPGPPQMEMRGSGRPPRRLDGGSIEFRNLTFAYEGREPALQGVSFTVPAGGLVVVVGPTGSGKSTLGALPSRLFEPPRGTVFVGGTDVRALDLGCLRRSIGYVPQEAFLFSRSLGENVLLAADEALPERLEAVAHEAGLEAELAALPDGWETVVGERGLTLSGGQRQRVALARALLHAPPFVVLDDVLAAVDAGKEREILDALRRASRGRTTLLMTHRLQAAVEADRVVVLDEGRVVAEGAHADLLAGGGLYARLWRVQQLEDELARS